MAVLAPVATGTINTAVLSTEYPLYEAADGRAYMAGVDATDNAAGDTVYIRTYMKFASGGSYILVDETEITGAKTIPGYASALMGNKYGIKFVLVRTAGTARDYDYTVQVYE